MRTVRVRNVSEAWGRLADTLRDATMEDSRAGPVYVAPEPVTTVYERPTERVLFCPRRNANPFFHLYEALWMLAGRADARSLSWYVGDFGARFAEPDGTIHGAYGDRWRHAMGFDQLEAVVHKLRASPSDRQAVIQMWDASCEKRTYERDGAGMATKFVNTGNNDLCGIWRDRPCNTHAYLRIRTVPGLKFIDGQEPDKRVLDLTVLCRSNDAVWGAYGANAVHFSMLQEYLAARIGVGVGRLYQVSNNFHVYRNVWEEVQPTDAQSVDAMSVTLGCLPMFDAPDYVDRDLMNFQDWHASLWTGGAEARCTYHNAWFSSTAERVVRAWFSYRARRSLDAAHSAARAIQCPAWRVACAEWLGRKGPEAP